MREVKDDELSPSWVQGSMDARTEEGFEKAIEYSLDYNYAESSIPSATTLTSLTCCCG